MEREMVGSRLGFLLLSAGSAIGLGNIWKFPYMVGEYGGGAFVLVYLVFLILLSMPVLVMEMSIGRASRKSPMVMMEPLEPKGTRWHLNGHVGFAGVTVILMFYTVIAGWMLLYGVKAATGEFDGLGTGETQAIFDAMTADPVIMTVTTAIIVCVGYLVCSFGLKNGLERVTKVIMVLMMVLMVILAVKCLSLSGAGEGIDFYLVPDFQRMVDAGITNVLVGAMSQAFFTMGLGVGIMAVFGSYADNRHSLSGEAITITALDTAVAICAGLIIFPACFTFGINPGSGPELIFVTMPDVFSQMPLGDVWGPAFFVFMAIAAFTSVLTMFEAQIASLMDMRGWSRKKTCAVLAPVMLMLSVPCILGFNVLSGFTLFGADVLGIEDFIASFVLMPLGALVYVLFCTSDKGWGWKRFLEEADRGEGRKFPAKLRLYCTYVLPFMIAALFVSCLVVKLM